jgi:hypothetical protein
MAPDEIPVHDISHLIFAFGFITPEDFKVTNMSDVCPDLFQQVTYLKNKNSDLVIQIALGGWSHNDLANGNLYSVTWCQLRRNAPSSSRISSDLCLNMDLMVSTSTGSIRVPKSAAGRKKTASTTHCCCKSCDTQSKLVGRIVS